MFTSKSAVSTSQRDTHQFGDKRFGIIQGAVHPVLLTVVMLLHSHFLVVLVGVFFAGLLHRRGARAIYFS